MAIAYGLLRLPAMPEIKEWKRKRETIKKEGEEIIPWQEAEVDVSGYPVCRLTRFSGTILRMRRNDVKPLVSLH